jgi:hypothetical protein
MTPSEHTAKTRSTKTGFFATLAARSPVKGTGAPSSTRGGTAFAATVLSLFALLALGATPALAAEPTLTVDPVATHAITIAHATGTITVPSEANGGAETFYFFEYSEAGKEEWNFGPQAFTRTVPAETTGQAVEEDLSGLKAAIAYEVRLAAYPVIGGEFFSAPSAPFTTDPAPQAPAVAVEATPSYLSAHIQGSVDPEGGNLNGPGEPVPIHWVIETSETGEPETWSEASSGDITGPEAEGSAPIAVSADPSLSPGKLYHYRLRAAYAGQQVLTSDETLTTLAVAKPSVSINPVTTFAAHTATFIGHVNPNSPEAEGSTSPAEEEAFKTHYRFECAPECPGLEGEVQADKTAHEVSAEATGLIPGHPYSVVLIASNSGGQETTTPAQFTTEALPPTIDATFATAVSETEATLGAKVNPGGAATTVHFEYLTLEQFENDNEEFGAGTTKTPESASIGSGVEDQPASAEIEGLEPNTAYRYRAVATNEKSPSGGTVGPARSFHTTTAGQVSSGCANEALRRQNNSTALPDCRAYEQVSPTDKVGFDAISRLAELQYPTHVAPSGEAIVYMGNGPFANARSSLRPTAHLSARTGDGWQTSDVSPPTSQVSPVGGGSPYLNFSEDLSQWTVEVAGQALAGLPVGSEGLYNLFLRKADGSYSLLNTAAPAEFPAPGAECYDSESCFQNFDLSVFAGASQDFTHVIFEANDSLTGTGAPGGMVWNLYENAGGLLRVVGVLPDGEMAPGGSVAGAGGPALERGVWSEVNHAISADGKRVLFESTADAGQPDPAQNGLTQLYDRIEGKETIEVSAPAPGATPANSAPQPAQYWNASDDGSLVFFTSAAELTTPSNTGTANNSQDLYRYNVDTETLTDLSVDTNPADAATGAGVQGVVGTSTDGSYVYFVANGELIPGEGVDGQPNLYVSHGGQLEYITTLGEGDATDWTSSPTRLRSYVTPDGRHLALMSTKSLPTANFPEGYDNTDQNTGGADTEVYTYSAEDGQLLCASCNPSGAQPKGGSFLGAQPEALASTAFHQPRVLSDSGDQLFFSSADSLAEGASGPFHKVYEYERRGAGSCGEEGGCLTPISTGDGENDIFLDAGADGKDVFFATLGRLAASDTDGLFDVYDARVEGGFAPEVVKPPCEGEGCLGSGSEPPPGTSRGTATFAGREEGPKHPKCGKGQRKRHGHCTARKAKHHKARHGHKANNNRRAGK